MSASSRLIIILVALIWGINFIIIRWGIEGVDAITMTALRFLFTALPMIFIIKKPDVSMWIIILYGILFGAGLWGLVNIAISLGTPAGAASLLLQMSAFLTVLIAVIAFNEQISKQKILGIILAFLGFLIFIVSRGETIPIEGIILVFIAAIFWSICNTIIKITKPSNVVSFIVWSSLFVPIPIVLISLGQQAFSVEEKSLLTLFQMPSTKGWVSILFQSYVTTLFGYSVWTQAISKHGLSTVAPYSLLVPVSGIFFGWLLYNETLSIQELLGSCLIIIGLILLSLQNLSLHRR